jgi:SH3-like domain-containing protein
MHTTVRAVAIAATFLLSTAAHAIDFRSVAEPAILFDSPSEKGKRLFIIAAGTPVEIVVSLDKWVKVRDAAGSINWIERRVLSDKRTVVVTSTRAVVRQRATADAPSAFEAVKDVVLEVAGAPTDGWLAVRHKDGTSGFVRVTEVWGL